MRRFSASSSSALIGSVCASLDPPAFKPMDFAILSFGSLLLPLLLVAVVVDGARGREDEDDVDVDVDGFADVDVDPAAVADDDA